MIISGERGRGEGERGRGAGGKGGVGQYRFEDTDDALYAESDSGLIDFKLFRTW